MLCHPCILRDLQRHARGVKSEVDLDIREQNQKWAPHPCVHGWEQNQKWAPHPCLLGTPKKGGDNTSICILGDPQRQKQVAKSEVVPNKEEQNQKWLLHSCPWGPKSGRKCYVTPAFSGAHKRAEMLRVPCILGNHQHRGTKSEVATSPVPPRGPKRGHKCDVTRAFSGIPNIGEQNQNCLPHPCLLAGPQEGEMLCHPCILRDPQHHARGIS